MIGLLATLALIAFGDSNTKADWMRWTGYAYENHGVNGASSWQAADIEAGSLRYLRDWLDLGAFEQGDVVVLMYGTNDVRWPMSGSLAHTLWSGTGLWGDFRRTRLASVAALEQMTDDALGAGLAVVLVVPPPIIEAPGKHTADEVARFNTRFRALADGIYGIAESRTGVVVVDAHAYFEALPYWPDPCLYTSQGSYDGVHMGGSLCPDGLSGQQHLAAAIAQMLQ